MSTPTPTGPGMPIKSALKSEDEPDIGTPPGSASMKGMSSVFLSRPGIGLHLM